MTEFNRPQLSVSNVAPLPRRTGHGDFPHPALAKVVSSRKHSQTNQSQVFQVSIEANTFPSAPASLTATAQMPSQSVAHEVIELSKRLPGMAQFEVVGPSFKVTIQPPDQLRQWRMTLSRSDQRPQRLPFPRHRFARRCQGPVALGPTKLVVHQPKGIAQKVQALTRLPQINDPSLFPVDLQAQPALQLPFDPAPQLPTDISGLDHEVIRITNEFRLGPLRRSVLPCKQM